MSDSSRNGARSKAALFFKEKVDSKVALYREMETERALVDTKIAKLRALRLAKEESEREEALRRAPQRSK